MIGKAVPAIQPSAASVVLVRLHLCKSYSVYDSALDEVALARISSARRATGGSIMRPSRRKAPRPSAVAAASPPVIRLAQAISSAEGEKPSFRAAI